MNIPFRKLYSDHKELEYIEKVIQNNKLSGNGEFCIKCEDFIQNKFNYPFVTLTSSCTAALEMAAIIMNIKEGDEVIIPSYTFVSTANAFALRGAKILFADSMESEPNVNLEHIEDLITEKTKAIVVVHYAGFSVNMDKAVSIAKKHNLFLIEDAAMAFQSYYKGRPLGSYGHFATFSFHETKNITSGEGGFLVINDSSLIPESYAVRDKGTNRQSFLSGIVSKYEWVSLGSAYSLTELQAGFLLAQLEKSEKIKNKRVKLWNYYFNELKYLEEDKKCILPKLKSDNTHNASVFYIILNSIEQRISLSKYLSDSNIQTAFHYQSLHKSPYYLSISKNQRLRHSERYSKNLLRLPLFYEMTDKEIFFVINKVKDFFC